MASPSAVQIDSSYKLAANCRDLDHLPGDYGKPVFGHTLRTLNDFQGYLHEARERYGLLFRTNVGFQRLVIALGPDLSRQVLLDENRDFSSEMGYARSMSAFFGGGLMLRDFDEHRRQRRIMQTAFKTSELQSYTGVMNPLFAAALDGAFSEPTLRFYPNIKTTLLRAAAHIFIGVTEPGRALDEMNRNFLDMVNALRGVVLAEIPGTLYYKGRRGRRRLHRFFAEMLPAKRRDQGIDMFSRFAKERDENGALYSDDDVIQQISFLMMAAHDTTTSALCSAVLELARHPDWQERLREEARGLSKPQLDYQDLDSLPLLDRFFNETLRLHSPVPMSSRRTVREVSLDGHRIPAHTNVSVAPTYTHHMAEWWPEPERFDPDRFSAERAEHKKHSFAFMPFGGGAHKCIGLHFAGLQGKCFLFQLLLKRRVGMPADYAKRVKYVEVPFPHPTEGLPIELSRL